MAKKMKRKKKAEPKVVFKRKIPIKKILPFAIILVLILTSYVFLKNSPYFSVKKISIVDIDYASGIEASDLIRIYKGRNIFNIDIKSLSSRMRDDHPFIKDVVVKRVLPEMLEISILSRVPVAKIKSKGYLPIDNAGMVLSSRLVSEDLPVITGVSLWIRPRAGEKIKNKKVNNALMLLEALKESSTIRKYGLREINVRDTRNLSFFLKNGIEVKIGDEEFSTRIKRLSTTLSDTSLDKDNIKYIDVRFRDVVIGPK